MVTLSIKKILNLNFKYIQLEPEKNIFINRNTHNDNEILCVNEQSYIKYPDRRVRNIIIKNSDGDILFNGWVQSKKDLIKILKHLGIYLDGYEPKELKKYEK